MIGEMRESGGRSKHSGTVVKKKTSSGCLVIKKKITDDRFTDSSSRNLFKSSNEKKRGRLVSSDSESSDSESESETFGNKSVGYKGAYVENREFGTNKRGGRGLDVFEFDEFDEYDGFDGNMVRKDVNNGRYRWNMYRQNGGGSTSRFEVEDDESDLPLSALRKKCKLSSGKAIRLQGKNGVLKVMVNKNKQMGVSHSGYDHAMADNLKEPKVGHKKMVHVDTNKKKSEMKSSFYSDSKHGEKSVAVKSKEKSHSRGESVKIEGTVKEVDRIKGKVQRGSGTEKQILREKIKNMLVEAGWTIDYRPRRNRAYMDAVYVNPAGTGYWSIIKAYDAFQKEAEDNSTDAGGRFTPLADEVLAKLTRQTQKKMEREMRSKRKSEDDEKEENLNSYGRKSRKLGRCSLLVRKAENDDGFIPYSGKRTLLSWLIDSGVVHLRDHVEYMNHRKTRILQKGWIAKDGIHCGCCSKIVTVSKFEVHAGSKLGHPYQNIFLESGKSLMQCQIDAWNKLGELERKGFYTVDAEGEDPNDDTCGLCGDGGDLICCDGCPSTFHQTCLDLPMLPQGDWFCPNCSCKYCDIACTNSTQASLLTCYLCQKKYHESCRPEIDVKPIESSYPNLSFCGHSCHELYSQLQKLVGVKHELESGFSWSLIRRSETLMDAPSVQLSQRVECNSMLAVAMSVMDECFLPFTDRRSGINLIRNVVFSCGSNLSRLDYSGFFTAILERGDEVVCAASIRIHGTRLAEMPFIGTLHKHRRQGMCRRLLSAIEVALSSLQVEKLIIPAVPEHMDTWTDVFGFHPLEESDKQELRCMSLVVFPRTDMLQKPLFKVNTDSGPCEPKRSGSVDAHLESDADESAVQVANEITTEPQLSGVKSVSCEPKHSGSVDAHSESDADESADHVANEITPEPQFPGVKSVSCESKHLGSVDAYLEPAADESAVHVADEITTEPQLLGEKSVYCEPKHPGSVDVHLEPDADESAVHVAKEITTEPQFPGVKSVYCEPKHPGSVDVHLEPDADESAVHVAKEITTEPQFPGVKSVYCEPKHPGSVDVHLEPDADESAVHVAKEITPEPQFPGVKSVYCEPKHLGSVDVHLEPDADESAVHVAKEITPEPQFPGVKSVYCEPKHPGSVDVHLEPDADESVVHVAKEITPEPQFPVVKSVYCEPKHPGSVDVHLEPDADESAVHVAKEITSEPQFPGVKSVYCEPKHPGSVDVHLEPDADVSAVHVAKEITPEPQFPGVKSVYCEPKHPGSVDVHLEPDADESAVHMAKEITPEPQFPGVKSVYCEPKHPGSVDVHLEPDADESAVHVAKEITPEPQFPGVKSVSCEPKHSGSVDAHLEPAADESAVHVADEITTKSQLLGMKSVSCEPKRSGSVDAHLEPAADALAVHVAKEITTEPQLPGVKSVFCEPKHLGSVDAHSESDADESAVQVANEITSEPQPPELESVSINRDSNAKLEETDVQNVISLEAQAPKEPSNIVVAMAVEESSGSDAEEASIAKP